MIALEKKSISTYFLRCDKNVKIKLVFFCNEQNQPTEFLIQKRNK